MRLTRELIDELLYEAESTTLDYKREQYKFERATDDEKSELLKDVLAFSNGHRKLDEDAFILIGVQENISGLKAQVTGINTHIDDAKLQQFVNSKTQKPIDFSYQGFNYDGQEIGVIHIPFQAGPFFLTRDFGRLNRNAVYVRRGTSTTIASPAEIAQMGSHYSREIEPSLDLQFIDSDSREPIGKKLDVLSVLLETESGQQIPDYGQPPASLPFDLSYLPSDKKDNKDYYRQVFSALEKTVRLRPISFALINKGESVVNDVNVEITIEDEPDNLFFSKQLPSSPSKRTSVYDLPDPGLFSSTPSISISKLGNSWNIDFPLGKSQPGRTNDLIEGFYIGAKTSATVLLEAKIFGDSLRKPILQTLEIGIDVYRQPLTLEELIKIAEE